MVKFGVKISQSGYGIDDISKLCAKAEGIGFESFWVADHMYSWGRKATDDEAMECWTLLPYLASITKKMRLGPLVSCPLFRHPAVLAKISSTVDVMSNGRLNFGIGLCGPSTPTELNGFGIGFPKRAERMERLTETVAIVKAMWTEETTNYSGKYYKLSGVLNSPKPVQKPHPPIWIGGENEDMLEFAAMYAQGWNCRGFTLDQFRMKVEALDAQCVKNQRRPDSMEKSWQGPILVAEDESRLEEMRARYPGRVGRIEGTPEQVVSQIRGYVDAGLTYFMFTFPDDKEDLHSMDVFAEKILPTFR